MKTLVTYASSTGNTRKIAEAIHSTIDGPKDIMSIKEVDDAKEYDVVFVGFPIVAATMPRNVRKFIAKHLKGRKVALFFTHGIPSEMDEFMPVVANCKDAAKGADILGTFECQGKAAPWLPKIMRLHPQAYVRRWAKMNDDAHGAGRPNLSDLEKARNFARAVMGNAQ
jgi:flavodoxin